MFTEHSKIIKRACLLALSLVVCLAWLATAHATTEFSYQGEIRDEGTLVNGSCDLFFSVWDAETGGTQLAPEQSLAGVSVSEGRFTVGLDFGGGIFEGTPRWLRIRAACPAGSTPEALSPRQPVLPAPHAQFSARVPWSGIDNVPPGLDDGDDFNDSVEFSEISPIVGSTSQEVAAGNHVHDSRYYTQSNLQQSGNALVHWDNIDQVPGDIADGDDDTTYGAGTGLTLSGTTFAADTSQIQARIGETCSVGSSIRAVNADGTVECDDSAASQTLQPPRDNRLNTANSNGWAGQETTIAIGMDGNPIIAEYDGINQDLRVVHCTDPSCSAVPDITTVDSTDDVGDEPTLTIGPDGYALVSYYDRSNGDLKVAHCQNVSCSSHGVSTVDQTDDVGRWSSITIGADGLPLISYHDATNGDLKVAHCGNASCSGTPQINTIDSTGDVGWYTSIAPGLDGRAWVSYFDNTNGDMMLARCDDLACTSASATAIASTGDVGRHSSVILGADNKPAVVYADSSNDHLDFAHCGDVSCSTVTKTTLDTVFSTDITMVLGQDRRPVISYYDGTNGQLKVAHCGDAACDAVVTRVVDDGSANMGQGTDLAIGVDGLPVISYHDEDNKALRVAHCASAACTPYFRR